MVRSKVVSAIGATKPASELSELLTREWYADHGFSDVAVRVRVIESPGGTLVLRPADHHQADERLPQLLGLAKDEAGQWPVYPYTGFCPPAIRLEKLGAGWTGPFVVRQTKSGKIFLAMPHPTIVAELEEKGVFDFSAQPAPAGSVFEPTAQGRYICRPKKGAVMIAVKTWDMEFQPDGTTVPYDNLVMKPALTALVWIAGPAEMVGKMDLSGLTLYDEERAQAHAGPKYAYAQEFFALGGRYTAFELFGDPLGENCANIRLSRDSDTLDLTAFHQNIKDILTKGDRWSKRVLLALIHEDHMTSMDATLRMLMTKAASGQEDVAEQDAFITTASQYTSLQELGELCAETVREVQLALDWLKDWAAWAETEIRSRNARGMRFGLPRPYDRPANTTVMAEMDARQVADQVLTILRENIAAGQRQEKPLATPAAEQTLTAAQIAAIRAANARRSGKKAATTGKAPVASPAPAATPVGPLSPKSPLRRKADKPTPADGEAHVAAATGEQMARVSGFAGEITVEALIAPEVAAQLQAIGEANERRTNGHDHPHPEQNPGTEDEVKCPECQRFVVVPQGWHGRMACDQHDKPKGKKAKAHLLVTNPTPAEPTPEPEPIMASAPDETPPPKKPRAARKRKATAAA